MPIPGIRRLFHLERATRRVESEIDDELRFHFDMTLRDLTARGTLVSVTAGVVAALAATRWIAPLLFEVSPHDPLVFGGVAASLFAVATLASLAPARRASRVDPAVALRAE